MSLPKFNKPPLTEVVLSVQFKPINDLNSAMLGILWDKYSAEFPKAELRSPLPHVIERLADRTPVKGTGELMFSNKPPDPRYWFIDLSGNSLVQVQHDRFARNWRKVIDSDVYPHYDEAIRPNFISEFSIFCDFIKERDLGEIEVDQCEVAYINHIEAGRGWEKHHQFSNIFNFLPVTISATGNIKAESAHYVGRNIIRDDNDNFIGRLIVNAEPAYKQNEDTPIYVFNLTARGIPEGPSIDSAIKFIDFGRKTIVQNFKDLTTINMHKVWELV